MRLDLAVEEGDLEHIGAADLTVRACEKVLERSALRLQRAEAAVIGTEETVKSCDETVQVCWDARTALGAEAVGGIPRPECLPPPDPAVVMAAEFWRNVEVMAAQG